MTSLLFYFKRHSQLYRIPVPYEFSYFSTSSLKPLFDCHGCEHRKAAAAKRGPASEVKGKGFTGFYTPTFPGHHKIRCIYLPFLSSGITTFISSGNTLLIPYEKIGCLLRISLYAGRAEGKCWLPRGMFYSFPSSK